MQKFIVAMLGAGLSTFFGFAGTAFVNTHSQVGVLAKVSQHTSGPLSAGTKMALNTQAALSISPTPSTTLLLHSGSEEQVGLTVTPTPDVQSNTEQQQSDNMSQSMSPTPEQEQSNQAAEGQTTPTVSQQVSTDTTVDTSAKSLVSNVSGLVQNVSGSLGL